MTPAQPPAHCGNMGICVYVSNRIRKGKSDDAACPVDAELEEKCPWDTRQQPQPDALDKIIPSLGRAIQTDISDNRYVMIEDLESTIEFIKAQQEREQHGE